MLNFLVLYVLEPQATILLAWYTEESLCNGPVSVHLSVRLSVCPIYRPLQLRAAGLLLGAPRAGDIDRQRRAPSSNGAAAANASSVTFIAAV